MTLLQWPWTNPLKNYAGLENIDQTKFVAENDGLDDVFL